MAPKVVIGYWNTRGYVHPIKLMLEHLGIAYEFQSQSHLRKGLDKSAWFEKKAEILKGYDFPNLPYFHDLDSGLRITQTHAIIMHIARAKSKGDLVPRDEAGLVEADVWREVLKDLMDLVINLCYDTDQTDEKKANFAKDAKAMFKPMEAKKSKTSSSKWLVQDQLTYVDFWAYETFDHCRILFPAILDECPSLRSFLVNFETLPNISNYLKSDRFNRLPLWGEAAVLGRSQEDTGFQISG